MTTDTKGTDPFKAAESAIKAIQETKFELIERQQAARDLVQIRMDERLKEHRDRLDRELLDQAQTLARLMQFAPQHMHLGRRLDPKHDAAAAHCQHGNRHVRADLELFADLSTEHQHG